MTSLSFPPGSGGGGGSFSPELAQDAIGGALQDSSTVNFTYNDGSNTILASVVQSNIDHTQLQNIGANTHAQIDTHIADSSIHLSLEQIQDNLGTSFLVAGTNIGFTYDDIGNTLTVDYTGGAFSGDTDAIPEGSTNLYFTNERVDDRVSALIQNGTGISWTYNDVANTLTANVSITQYTDEMAQDAVGTILTDSSTIDFTYNDAGNTISASVIQAGIDHTQIQNIGTNTHGQIDTHIADGSIHFTMASKSTDDLSEGTTNKYFTNERAQDAIGAALTGSSTIDFTYNDGANTISAEVIPGGISHMALADIGDYSHIQIDNHIDATSIHLTMEQIQDNLGTSFIVAGAGVTATYDDTANTLTLATTITQYTNEMAQDTIGGCLVDSSTIDFTYDDASNTITADVIPGGISHASLANVGTNSHTAIDNHIADSSIHLTLEQIQDNLGNSFLVAGSNITLTYNDASNTLTIASTGGGGGSGETNTASNYGNAGVGVYDSKNGVDLRFRNLNPASSKITATLDNTNHNIDLDVSASAVAAALTTSDLTEGSNLYFTNERVDDRVAALIQNGTGITWTYNDASNTLTGNVSITQYTDEMAQDAVGGILTDSATIDFTYNDGDNTITATVIQSGINTDNITEGSTNLFLTNERIDDRVAALIQNGTGISWTYDDASNTLTGNVSITQYTDEMAQDAVGTILTDSSTIDFTYNDAANTITATVIQSGINTDNITEGSTNLFLTNERVDDRVAALIQNGTGLSWTYNDASNTLTGNVSITQYTDEMAQDAVGTILTDSSTIDFTYNDGANTITAAVIPGGISHTGLTNIGTNTHAQIDTHIADSTIHNTIEQIQDNLGNSFLVAGSNITLTYDDTANTLTIASSAGSSGYPKGYMTGPPPRVSGIWTVTIPSGFLCRDSTDAVNMVVSSDLNVVLTSSGANGLDSGSKAANTWYYLYLISKVDGTVAGLLSTVNEASSGSITLPATYVYKRQLRFAVKNDTGNATTFTAATSDIITPASMVGVYTGMPFQVSSTTTLPAGLSASTTYYAGTLTSSTFKAHPTLADAVAGTNAIDITSTGSGTHTILGPIMPVKVVSGWPERPYVRIDWPLTRVTGAATITVGPGVVVNNGSATTATATSFSKFVPPISREVRVQGHGVSGGAFVSVRETGTAVEIPVISSSAWGSSMVDVGCNSSQNIDYYNRIAGNVYIDPAGFYITEV